MNRAKTLKANQKRRQHNMYRLMMCKYKIAKKTPKRQLNVELKQDAA